MIPTLRQTPRAFRSAALAAVALVVALTATAQADEHGTVFGERETKAIESIVTDYLIEHPEIIIQAIQALQEREEEAEAERARLALEEHRDALENDPNTPVGGNPNGDVTIVEFFDYRCPYCKRVAPDVARLLESDGNIRLVYKEWPILGPESVFAARAALAAREQGKYIEFHERIMDQRQVTEASVLAAAEDLGLDIDRMRTDMESDDIGTHLDETMQLAEALGINGTPAFVIGDQLIPGVASLDQFKVVVDRARSRASQQ